MATHRWHLEIELDPREQISELPSRDRMAVFDSIRELLEAENPTAVNGVKKLLEKRFEGQWRQRRGDYRIFFRIQSGEINVFKHTYKGILTITAVLHRSKAY